METTSVMIIYVQIKIVVLLLITMPENDLASGFRHIIAALFECHASDCDLNQCKFPGVIATLWTSSGIPF